KLPIDGRSANTEEEAEAALRLLIDGAQEALVGPVIDSELVARPGHSQDRSNEHGTAEIRYRALVEQIPAITFLAAMDRAEHEFYVSPQIEAILGFSQKEWLENPILWYQQLH